MDQNELFGPEVHPDRGPNCLAKMSETSNPDVLIHDLRNFHEFLTIRVSRLTVRLLSRESMPFKKFGSVYNPVQFRFMVFINDQFELFRDTDH